MNNSALGQRIRALRKTHGWSAQQLADNSGGRVTRSVIADIENGRRGDLTLSQALGVSNAFRLSVEELVDLPEISANICDEIAATIAANIARRRVELGLTLDQHLGRLERRGLKLHKSSLSDAENGKRWLKAQELLVMALALQTTVTELLPDKDEIRPALCPHEQRRTRSFA